MEPTLPSPGPPFLPTPITLDCRCLAHVCVPSWAVSPCQAGPRSSSSSPEAPWGLTCSEGTDGARLTPSAKLGTEGNDGDWRPGPLAPSLGLCACPRGQGRLDGVRAPCRVAWLPRPPWARLHQAAQSASSPKGPAPLGRSWWEGRHCWNVPSQERRVGGPLHQQIPLAAQVPPPPGSLTQSPVACASCPHVCGSHSLFLHLCEMG